MSTHPDNDDLEFIKSSMERFSRAAEAEEKRYSDFMAMQPATRPCAIHPDIIRPICRNSTHEATRRNQGNLTPGYAPCPKCAAEQTERAEQKRLHKQGVPTILLTATLDNFRETEGARGHLDMAKEFAKTRAGFLLLLGTQVGTGKTHMAVGIMRLFPSAFFVKQNTLLRMLRDTYRDRKAEDPVELCQDAGLLVLDEIGITGGGRDEAPMLHEILDHRHGEKKPTVLTSNLEWPELSEAIGVRLADRLKQSTFRILTFGGASQRVGEREKYFASLPAGDTNANPSDYDDGF